MGQVRSRIILIGGEQIEKRIDVLFILVGFTYYFTLTPINNYGRLLSITFTPSINAGYILTQPKTFHVSGDGINPRKPDITFSLKSTRELTNQELKALIVVNARDSKTNEPVQVNDKDSLSLDFNLKSVEANFSVKGWYYLT